MIKVWEIIGIYLNNETFVGISFIQMEDTLILLCLKKTYIKGFATRYDANPPPRYIR